MWGEFDTLNGQKRAIYRGIAGQSQGNNDIKELHVQIPVHIPTGTIFPSAHLREVLFLALDYKHRALNVVSV